MVADVTVQSSFSGSIVTIPFSSADNLSLANAVAFAISTGVASGTVHAAISSDGPPPKLRHGESGAFFQETTGLTILPSGYK